MQFNEHQVVIAGGGPTGLMLAGELALAGVDVAIVEQRLTQAVEGSRASGLHPRAIELLDQRGIAEPFLAQGKRHPVVMFAGAVLDASDRPTRHSYSLALWQDKIEQGLAEWVSSLGVRFYRGATVTGFRQTETHVDVELADGGLIRAPYLVGCDGGRSVVRKTAGIDFPGWEPTVSYLIFEASLPNEPALGLRHGERGVHGLGRLEDSDRIRGVVTEERLETGIATESQLSDALIAAYGADFGLRDISWLSRFTDAARQAASYRKARVLVAGDAAHVHSPVGGQGLNIGLQDAVNLGWKLAQVVKGETPDSLLDSYHAERHPAGAALLQHTLALTALNRGDARTTALRALTAKAMQMDAPRKWYGAMMSGLDIRHDCGDGHPLLGYRMPDLDIVTAQGPTRIFTLLHAARPVLLTFGTRGPAIDGWQDRVTLVEASCDAVCELPVVGVVPLPAAVLIRPDGHVAWVGDERGEGLVEALTAWFGPASA